MTDSSSFPPFIIEVTRGDMVESRHQGAAAVVDADGKLAAAWGDIDRPIFARSAIKPLQALPLLETGAADRFGLGDKELSLACASHNGEPGHVKIVLQWLERIGLGAGDLECGTHLPSHEPSAHALLRGGESPSPPHNNCSGKHTAMLTHAMHLGEIPKGYIDPGHPAQRRAQRALEEMTGWKLDPSPRGTDGCGFPQFGIPLRALALAMAKMADPSRLPTGRREAAGRILKAIAAEPFMIGGSGRFCTSVAEVTQGRVIAKAGAEGVYAAIIPGLGLGVVLKIADGSARPRNVALGEILRHIGALGDKDWSQLQSFVRPILRNHAKLEVGTIRPGEGWPQPRQA